MKFNEILSELLVSFHALSWKITIISLFMPRLIMIGSLHPSDISPSFKLSFFKKFPHILDSDTPTERHNQPTHRPQNPTTIVYMVTYKNQGRKHGQYQSRTGGQGRKMRVFALSNSIITDGPTDGRTKPLIESLVRD